MKHFFFAALMLLASSAQAQNNIQLPAPELTQSSLSLVETLATRHSVRAYEDTPLTLQQISNLCWAACGRQRDDQHITAPSAMNRQEVLLYVFTAEGICLYDAASNQLIPKASGDYRNLIAHGQDFAATAPLSLVMVVDFSKLGSNDRSVFMGCVDTGIVCQNINLYCQAVGLATVPRATMDAKGIAKLLNLPDSQLPLMNNPVGYEKK